MEPSSDVSLHDVHWTRDAVVAAHRVPSVNLGALALIVATPHRVSAPVRACVVWGVGCVGVWVSCLRRSFGMPQRRREEWRRLASWRERARERSSISLAPSFTKR